MTLGCFPVAATAANAHEPGTAIDIAPTPARRNFLLDKGCCSRGPHIVKAEIVPGLEEGRLGSLGAGRSYMCSKRLPWAAILPTLHMGRGKMSSTAIAHRSL